MKILKNFLWNSSYQLFVLIVPFITIPYVSRVLGPTGIGINSFTNSVVQYFVLLGSLGFTLYGNREIAYHRDDKEAYTKIFWEICLLRALTTLVASLLFFGFVFIYAKFTAAFFMQYFVLFAVIFDISWFFMGMENFRVTVTRNFVIKLISVASIFIFVKSKNDVLIYILIISGSTLLGNLTIFPYLRRYLVPIKFSQLNIWRHLKPSLVLFIPQIAVNIYIVLNKTMLGQLDSVTAAGYFDSSDKVIKISLAVLTATGTVMLPHIANAYAKGEFYLIKKFLVFFFDFASFLAVPMMFGLMAISHNFAIWFFGKKFAAVGLIMQIESIVIPIMAWSSVVGKQYLLPENRNKSYTVAVTIGAILSLVLNIPLILKWGANGAAVATVISELGVTAYELYVISSEINLGLLFKDLWKYLLSGIVMFGVVYYINTAYAFNVKILILSVFVGVLVYMLGLVLLRSAFLKSMLIRLKKLKKS